MNTIVCEYHGVVEDRLLVGCLLCHNLVMAAFSRESSEVAYRARLEYKRGLLTPREALHDIGRLDLLPQKPKLFRCWCTKPATLYKRPNGWGAECEKHLGGMVSDTAYGALRNNGESHTEALDSLVKYLGGKKLASVFVYESKATMLFRWSAWLVAGHYLVAQSSKHNDYTTVYTTAKDAYQAFAHTTCEFSEFQMYVRTYNDAFLHAEG